MKVLVLDFTLSPLMSQMTQLTGWTAAFAQSAVIAFGAAFLATLAILASAPLHARFSYDHLNEIQKIHQGGVPRIGGIAVLCGLYLASLVWWLAAGYDLLILVIYASLPAFAMGVTEDLTRQISVRVRLAATFTSGLLGCILLHASINHVGVASLDWALSYPLFAFAFTAFACAGLATSINILDGLNGLSSWVSIAILIAFASLTQDSNQELYHMALLGALAIAGFLMLNWPWGKIFLGDGGAYLVGLLIAWIAILIHTHSKEISAFALLLVCAYPVIETLFSMARRIQKGKLVGRPDQLHLHHQIYLLVKHSAKVPARALNSVCGILCATLCLPPIFWALSHPNDKALLIAGFGVYVLAYWALYSFLARAVQVRNPAQMNTPGV
jgi:UDP-N-acetylmuramyl pentapeptide phosphotransferase/UDP-N-acetylglucosamine-1-phosphate transferase